MKRFALGLGMVWMVVAGAAQGRISEQALKTSETVTAEKLFLDQVDKVSLYLTTKNIVYAPRFDKASGVLRMAITLLDTAIPPRSERLRQFVMRHIQTFNQTLTERLNIYTPALAKEFDTAQDVVFSVQVGAAGQAAARFEEGKWIWLKEVPVAAGGSSEEGAAAVPNPVSAGLSEAAVSSAVEVDVSECKRRCPALIGRKIEAPPAPTRSPAPPAPPPAGDETKTKKKRSDKVHGDELPL